jgi:hypothetical protein
MNIMLFETIEAVDQYIPIPKQLTHWNAPQNLEILDPVLHCLPRLGRDGPGSIWDFFEWLVHVESAGCD